MNRGDIPFSNYFYLFDPTRSLLQEDSLNHLSRKFCIYSIYIIDKGHFYDRLLAPSGTSIPFEY
jgi:hypothetical protein